MTGIVHQPEFAILEFHSVAGGRSQMKERKRRRMWKKDSVSFLSVPAANAMHYRDTKQAITA